jgi:hypothetical protein
MGIIIERAELDEESCLAGESRGGIPSDVGAGEEPVVEHCCSKN